MYTPDTHNNAPKVRRSKADCCTELACESGLRNNYFPGKQLTTESFRVEQDHTQQRRWMLNRAMHGWGVVYGYPLASSDRGWLDAGPGLALDSCGRELVQVVSQRIELEDVLVLDDKRRLTDPGRAFTVAELATRQSGRSPRVCWLLSVHYAERDEGPVQINDPCSCERREWDRTCETVRYSLRSIPCAECCDDGPCELTCGCGSGSCCEEEADPKNPEPRGKTARRHGRGGCRCMCDHLTSLSFEPCGRLCAVEDCCGGMRVDLEHGVPLACVEVVRDGCDEWTFGDAIDACGPRRLVKRNDLLFDLVRGCDLTRISEIGWADWHRRQTPEVPFEEFSEALGPEGDHQSEYVTSRFWVRFSRPVREETLLPDCIAITVMSFEREGGWWESRRVPIVRLDRRAHSGDPAGHVSEAVVVVDGRWLEDGVRGRWSLFLGAEAWVEIEVRGDLIVDCNGQAVDGNAVGLSPDMSGNGTPGGTFISSFRVAAASEAPARPPASDSSQRVKGASS